MEEGQTRAKFRSCRTPAVPYYISNEATVLWILEDSGFYLSMIKWISHQISALGYVNILVINGRLTHFVASSGNARHKSKKFCRFTQSVYGNDLII